MKNLFYKLLSIMLVFSLAFSLVSCSDNDGSGYIFRYSVIDDPKNLDPQLSTDDASLNVVSNLFVGLLALDENGNITNGVSQSYEVSGDGLIYTFNLSEDFYWKSKGEYKENLTADDFVFTFQRLANKLTNSPYSENFFMIKNLKKIYDNELDMSKLGVYKKDKYTLVIELENPDNTFPILLTTPAAFPCKESFFNDTHGKYGLETDCVVSNGAFYLNSWLYDPYGQDNYVILKRNPYYNDIDRVFPSGINYFITRDRQISVSDYKGDKADVIVDNGTATDIYNNKSIVKGFNDSTTGIIFNMSDPIFSMLEVRQALAYSINRNLIDELPNNIQPSGAIVPSSVKILNKSFRELVSEPAYSFQNVSKAKYLWLTSLTNSQLDSISGTTLITSDKFSSSSYYSQIISQWNEAFGFYCPVEVLPHSKYQERIKNGDYKLAVTELSADYNSPAAFLDFYSHSEITEENGFEPEVYDEILENAKTTLSLSDSIDLYSSAEGYLIENAIFIPVFYQSEYLIYNNKLSDITFNPFNNTLFFLKSKKQ